MNIYSVLPHMRFRSVMRLAISSWLLPPSVSTVPVPVIVPVACAVDPELCVVVVASVSESVAPPSAMALPRRSKVSMSNALHTEK